MKRFAAIALGLVALLAAAGMAAFFVVGRVDLGPWAARRASAALGGRAVAVGALHVTPGRWIAVDLQDLRIDNLPGGTRPTIATLDRLTAEVDALSLLHGPAVVRTLRIDGLSVLLERLADRAKNWRFAPETPHPGPPDRNWFPTLLDVQVRRSEVVFRTSGGTALVTKLDDATIRTASAEQSVQLAINGAYHGAPIQLKADLQPLAVLRDASVPYGTVLHFASDDTTLDFNGTMTAPFDLDGARGVLSLSAPTPGPLLAIAGVSSGIDAALNLSGPFEHEGDLWLLTKAAGALDRGAVSDATLRLQEGGAGRPDDVSVEATFDRLDLDKLLGAGHGGGRPDTDVPLAIDSSPDTLLAVRLAARQAGYGGVTVTDARLAAALTPGRLAVSDFSMTYAGARSTASGAVEASGRGGRVSLGLSVANADVQTLRRLLGSGPVPLLGRLEMQAAAQSDGATLNAAVRAANVSAVVSMTGGSVAREVVEMASTDVRLLFRRARGMTPVSCLLGVLTMRGGAGTVAPLRLRAAEGTIAGNGTFDLQRRRIDVTIGSEAASTSAFALDVPVRISGSLADPSVRPARWSAAGRAQLASADTTAALPPGLRQAAQRNPCSRPGR
jgi:uncharacterized protein involved in outer membrane biogenesis